MIEKGIQQKLIEKIEAQPIELNPVGWSRNRSILIREKVLHFTEVYPEVCDEIFDIYKILAEKNNVELGTMRIYWVGGRIRDKAIGPMTDLDIIITFDSKDYYNVNGGDVKIEVEKIKEVFCKYGLCTLDDHSKCNQLFDYMLIIPRADNVLTDPNSSFFDEKKYPRIKIFERKVN